MPAEAELEPYHYDFLSYSTQQRKTGFRRPLVNRANVASWNTDQNSEEHIYQEISRIIAASMADAKVEVTLKHNNKVISHFRLKTVSACRNILIPLFGSDGFLVFVPWQDYKIRDGTGGNRIYVCPF